MRRREECTTPNPWNTGDPERVADYDYSLAGAADWRTTTEPLTTIGWLFWHVGSQAGRLADLNFLGGSETASGGWTSPYLTLHPVFATAADAVETMRIGWRRLTTTPERSGSGTKGPHRWLCAGPVPDRRFRVQAVTATGASSAAPVVQSKKRRC